MRRTADGAPGASDLEHDTEDDERHGSQDEPPRAQLDPHARDGHAPGANDAEGELGAEREHPERPGPEDGGADEGRDGVQRGAECLPEGGAGRRRARVGSDAGIGRERVADAVGRATVA